MALLSFRLRRVLWFGLFVLGTGAILIASKVVLRAAAPALAALPALALLMLQNACALAFGLLGRAWPRRPLRWWLSPAPLQGFEFEATFVLNTALFNIVGALPVLPGPCQVLRWQDFKSYVAVWCVRSLAAD